MYMNKIITQVLLPLQTHPLLLSLHRTPKTHRPSSPSHQLPSPDVPSTSGSSFPIPGTLAGVSMTPPIDVRTLALCAFRDQVIFPISSRLETRISSLPKRDSSETSGEGLGMTYQQPRLQQMWVSKLIY